MATGISTQSGPLKPCCPTFIWVTPPSYFASMPSSSSSHAVSTSAKALHRRELHFLHSADGHCCSVTGFRSSCHFKLNSSYSLIMNNSACMFDRTKSHWRLVVRAEQRRSSTSSAQMFPYSEREMVKNKNMHRRLHEPPTTEREVIQPYWSSDHWTPTDATSPSVVGSKADWCKESYKLKIAKELNKSMSGKNSIGIPLEQNVINSKKPGLNCLQDGSGFEKDVSFDSINRLRLEHIAMHGDYRSSFSRESVGEMEIPRLPSMQPSSNVEIGSGKGRGVGVTNLASYKNNALRLTASNKQVFRSRNNNYNSMQAGSFTAHDIQCNGTLLHEKGLLKTDGGILNGAIETNPSYEKSDTNSDLNKNDVEPTTTKEECSIPIQKELHKKLCHIYDKVIVVDNVISAKKVVGLLTEKYRHLVHACDTEVANIDVKEETPVDHGEIICFSIYSGPEADFGDGKSCIWVDVLDGGMDLLMEFAPFFEDPLIKKVWHNYSFDSHVIENYGLKISGFHADTMHMARLWDSSRRLEGGYSLEALTSDSVVMSETKSSTGEGLIGKFSMKTIFGKRKIKKDGFEGKIITIAPVEELQREERVPWICYSALDSISTLKLFNSMRSKLMAKKWHLDGKPIGSMYNFYEKYWRPFGKLLVKMEAEGMLVDRAYLSEMEKLAILEQGVAASRFRKWASKHCADAFYMNVGSDAQLRQLFFGGMKNRKDPTQDLPKERKFKVLNVDKIIEEGKKVPTKFRTIKLHTIVDEMQTEMYTSAGWPSVCGDALKNMAGKVSSEYDWNDEEIPLSAEVDSPSTSENVDTSLFGTAYAAFGGEKGGREACHAIAALCEVCSIDSLISNFILPLQSSVISGKDGRIHCSLNINTETGRLSARRPNLQNQPALEKDRYKIRQAFIAAPGKSLIVADYGQLELRILAHVANCKSMLNAFEAGGDFHSRTAMNMYPHIRRAVEQKQVLLEWHPQPGEDKPPAPLLKDAFASERRKAKMLNFSIAYGKTPVGLARDWKVSIEEAKETVNLWYKERKEVLQWQRRQKHEAKTNRRVHTLLGRARMFPSIDNVSNAQRGHIERAAINTPVQGSAADVAMCAMLEISRNPRLKELGWKLLLQVHDEVILEGPTESAEEAKAIVVECMSKPFEGKNILNVDLAVDAKCAQNWYAAK